MSACLTTSTALKLRMTASGVYSILYQCWALSLEYDLFNEEIVNTFSESKVKFVLSYPPPPLQKLCSNQK